MSSAPLNSAVMDCVCHILGTLLPGLRNPVVVQHASYLLSAEEKLDNISNAMEDLKAKTNDIDEMIIRGKSKREEPTEEVKRWLTKVGNIHADVIAFTNNYEQRHSCFIKDFFPNCYSNYQANKKATKLQEDVEELKRERGSFSSVLMPSPPEYINEMTLPSTVKVGKSVESHIEMVRSYLSSEEDEIIGIWGMGGVGKTTLLKLINNSLFGKGNLGFDFVIWAEATRDDTLQKLQHTILCKLGLEEQKDVSLDANIISSFLRQKNFLLLVDGLFEAIDLTRAGIPISSRSNVAAATYKQKLVFTTRFDNVCGDMKSQRRIKVEFLESEEAKLLLKEIVPKYIINSDQRIPKLLEEIACECDGLPLALIVIGSALSSKKTFREWEFTVESLKTSKLHVLPAGVEKEIFATLKLSYDYLQDDVHRECFLSCCLWPVDQYISINDLIECWMGLGLINKFDKIHEAYNQGYSIIGDLKGACLLQPDLAEEDEYVKLHGVIWDLALWIATERSKWTVRSGSALNELSLQKGSQMEGFPSKGHSELLEDLPLEKQSERLSFLPSGSEDLPSDWCLADRISAMNSRIVCLPEPRTRTLISILILKGSMYMISIPHGCFQKMILLKYLDLSYTALEELPTDVGDLRQLEYLNLSHTQISSLPSEISELQSLRFLLLRGVGELDDKSIVLIQYLARLHVIDVSPYNELDLYPLRYRGEYIKSISMAVKSYKTLAGITHRRYMLRENFLHIQLYGIQSLSSFELEMLSDVQPSLQELELVSCGGLKTMCSHPSNIDSSSFFPRLEKFRLCDLPDLRKIRWSRNLLFPSLRILVIQECPLLRNISWVVNLPRLRKLQVVRCHLMEQLIDHDDMSMEQLIDHDDMSMEQLIDHDDMSMEQLIDHDDMSMEQLIDHDDMSEITEEGGIDYAFPNLRELCIDGLPQLRSICRQAIKFPSLESIVILGCPQLKKLPFHSQMVVNNNNIKLKCIGGNAEWLEGLEWDSDDAKSPFRRYFRERLTI